MSAAKTAQLSETAEFHGRGFHIRVLASKKDTEGAYTVLHYTLPAGATGAPPHFHKVMNESFYVLDGRLTLLKGTETITARAGALVSVPPGTIHGFRNDEETTTVFLIFAVPGGLDELLGGLFRIAEETQEWPPRDPSRIVELGTEHDTYYRV